MSLPVIIRPEAEQDLEEARNWYEGQRTGLGGEFVGAVDDVLGRIGDFPELYPAEYRGVRRAVLSRFPYVVYYRTTDSAVEVLAVLHGSRHPRTWRSRA
jgi:plasmid stabilization system protein ParE